jgi:hypothetical protein
VVFSFSKGQIITDISIVNLNKEAERNQYRIDFNDPSSYKGSPYSNPKFVLGSIYRNDTLILDKLALRYNAISDQIEVKRFLTDSNDEIRNLIKSSNLVADMGKSKFEYVPFEGTISKRDYLEVIYEGRQVDIYKKHVKEVKYPVKAVTSITRDLPAQFTDKPMCFLVTKRKQFYQFPESIKNRFKVFGAKGPLMKKYAKENKLDIKEELDLIKIVSYFEKR